MSWVLQRAGVSAAAGVSAEGWGSAVCCGFAAGLNTTESLEFAASAINAPGKAGYP